MATNTSTSTSHTIAHRHQDLDGGVRVFYREAGDADKPVLLLLHGFPSSSFQFRNLIPLLADKFRVIAPDLPGFGFTTVPADYHFTFEQLAKTIDAFVQALSLALYTMYLFDYGAPVGLRLALAHPERVSGLISQNGNAYVEGLGAAWAPIQAYWANDTLENRNVLRDNILTLDTTRWQYENGVPAELLPRIAPETYTLDYALMSAGGNKEIQLDLFRDYASNVALYPAFQQFFRERQPKSLVIWGKNDAFFTPPGAEAFKRDNAEAIVELLDGGHFVLESHVEYVAQRIREVFAPDIKQCN